MADSPKLQLNSQTFDLEERESRDTKLVNRKSYADLLWFALPLLIGSASIAFSISLWKVQRELLVRIDDLNNTTAALRKSI